MNENKSYSNRCKSVCMGRELRCEVSQGLIFNY